MAGPSIRYFLGANTPSGFYSLYDQLIDPERAEAVYILKGGPGCGKSTFMKTVAARAEERGLEVERILCSGDPASLDAILIPVCGAAVVDGTAPHDGRTDAHERSEKIRERSADGPRRKTGCTGRSPAAWGSERRIGSTSNSRSPA